MNAENYKKLCEALTEYHRMVEAGILIPRERMVDDIYKVYPFSYNGARNVNNNANNPILL